MKGMNVKENMVEMELNTQATDTKGLITYSDRGTLTFKGGDLIAEKGVQTNLHDVVEFLNEIETQELKKKEEEDISTYNMRFIKLDIDLSDSVIIKNEAIKYRQQEEAHNFRALELSKLELHKRLSGLQSLTALIDWFVEGMEKFFFSINGMISRLEGRFKILF